MRRPSRPSTRTTTTATIALVLLGLVGGIAVYRSRPAPSSASPTASPAAARTTVPPRGANGAGRVTTPILTWGGVRLRSDDPNAGVRLLVPPRRRGLVRIGGIASANLAPGVSARVDLVLSNPNAFAVTVRRLNVRLRSIRAPSADLDHTCTGEDFSVAQFSGSGVRLPPASTTALSRLGVTPARWPRVSMLDREADQDGCKGAALTLDTRGVGRR